MPVKRLRSESVVWPVPQGPRDMVKAELPEPQFPDGVTFTRRQNACNPAPLVAPVTGPDRCTSDERTMTNEAIQGDERGTYSRARTSCVTVTRDGLRDESPRVTKSS